METANTVADALTFALLLIVVVMAGAALAARSLVVTVLCCMMSAAVAGLILVAAGANLAGLAMVGAGVAFFPILLFVGLSLSASSIKARKQRSWLTFVAACALVGLVFPIAPELVAGSARAGEPVVSAPLLGAMAFVAVSAVVALVGYGERGILGQRGGRARP
jgi:hypothetical protein